MAGRLEGRVAMITGAGGTGLGRAGAYLFAREGARVVALDINEAGLEETVQHIRAEGGSAIGVRADVSRIEEVRAVVEAGDREFGRIDILWNNAAMMGTMYTPLEEIEPEVWNRTFMVNVGGYFHAIKCVVPQMKARRSGVILNTTSMAALIALRPGIGAYSASKGAIVSMTRQLALELGPFNIRVNCLAGGHGGIPGTKVPRPDVNPFDTVPYNGGDAAMPQSDVTRRPRQEELAHTALFLVDDAAGPMNGVILPHDGGRLSR